MNGIADREPQFPLPGVHRVARCTDYRVAADSAGLLLDRASDLPCIGGLRRSFAPVRSRTGSKTIPTIIGLIFRPFPFSVFVRIFP
ncbi:hypothetical protein C6Q03_04755 [Burkholderia multivorans]|nr:hypothetical protein C6Q03_04755 [Burkholderia multivorans]